MITVHCELKDNKLYKLVDEAFVNEAGMKKVSKGNYEGDASTFSSSYMSIRELFDTKGFINNVIKFTRNCGDGDGEFDLVEHYNWLSAQGWL